MLYGIFKNGVCVFVDFSETICNDIAKVMKDNEGGKFSVSPYNK